MNPTLLKLLVIIVAIVALVASRFVPADQAQLLVGVGTFLIGWAFPELGKKGSGGTGAAAAVVLALMLPAAVSTTACSSVQARAAGAETQQAAKGVFTGAVLAVRVLDDVNAAWMASLATPTDVDVQVARTVTKALTDARNILNAAQPYIDKDGSGLDQIKKAYELLDGACGELEKVGVKIPPELDRALEFVGGYVGAAS
ncbi:MAG TPA: hypothetical protein VFV10_14235 [Gammaproteobacteria bacterium]|nr:hypothetical protein [Gammaproteobacteria bacterium]